MPRLRSPVLNNIKILEICVLFKKKKEKVFYIHTHIKTNKQTIIKRDSLSVNKETKEKTNNIKEKQTKQTNKQTKTKIFFKLIFSGFFLPLSSSLENTDSHFSPFSDIFWTNQLID